MLQKDPLKNATQTSNLIGGLNRLAEDVLSSKNFIWHQVKTKEEFDLVKSTLGQDFRAVKESVEGVRSALEGLAFDPQNVRIQVFYTTDGEKPVAVTTLAIAPKKWIEQQRYLLLTSGEIEVCHAWEIYRIRSAPEYLIMPAWTKVAQEHRGHFAFRGLKFIQGAIQLLEREAPRGTWLELIAMGKYHNQKVPEIDNLKFGESLPLDNLPFPIEDFGTSCETSISTIKLASFLKLPRIGNAAHGKTLGPIFAKFVK
jgi:hypothetical protein